MGGNSFFAGLETRLKNGNRIAAPQDEVRTPIDVITLSECVLELAVHPYSGLLHIGSIAPIDRYKLSRRIAHQMGYDEEVVVLPKEQTPDPNRAPRHRNGILDVSKAQQLMKTKLLSVDEGIQRAFLERKTLLEA